MARIKIRKNTIAPIHTFFDEVQPNNISNNNNDIISQSTIVAKKENTFMNNYIYLLYNINFLNNIIAFSQLQS